MNLCILLQLIVKTLIIFRMLLPKYQFRKDHNKLQSIPTAKVNFQNLVTYVLIIVITMFW